MVRWKLSNNRINGSGYRSAALSLQYVWIVGKSHLGSNTVSKFKRMLWERAIHSHYVRNETDL